MFIRNDFCAMKTCSKSFETNEIGLPFEIASLSTSLLIDMNVCYLNWIYIYIYSTMRYLLIEWLNAWTNKYNMNECINIRLRTWMWMWRSDATVYVYVVVHWMCMNWAPFLSESTQTGIGLGRPACHSTNYLDFTGISWYILTDAMAGVRLWYEIELVCHEREH